jgi:hypothetical protein
VLTAESESADRVTLRWQIARDYPPKDRLVSHDEPDAKLGAPVLPPGKTKHDDIS